MKPNASVDTSAAVVAAGLVAFSAWVLWQSRDFTPFAAIFPRAVGAALMICSLLMLWRILRRRTPGAAAMDRHGKVRSGLLVLTMLVWVPMLELAGFTLASVVAFFVLALLANRDPLRPMRIAMFAAVSIACVLVLQLLFQRGLDVRLPAGSWLPGLFG